MTTIIIIGYYYYYNYYYNYKYERPAVDEFVMLWITRHPLHDVALRLFICQRDGWHKVGAEVDTEDGNGAEWQRDISKDEDQERRNLWDVARQSVRNRLFEVVEDQTTCT